jgi:AraC family transcriptional regulator of adaptative response / DNA-3-methyladenine glycosylase II
LVLAYRPPFDWDALLRFLAARAIPGVECVTGSTYHRTAGIGEHRGWLSVARVAQRDLLAIDIATALVPALPSILIRLRNLFDLDARPDVIAGHLALDPMLAPRIKRQLGLRVPGAFDVFELGMRAILGQQISVRGASTLAGRLVERFGEPIATPLACLNRITPTADSLSRARSSELAKLGLPGARAETLRNLAALVAGRQIALEPGADPAALVGDLMQLKGIGPWTAQYIAMRALRWPDAFPSGDLGLIKASRCKSAAELQRAAELWRPWRAYAAMHLWESLRTVSD